MFKPSNPAGHRGRCFAALALWVPLWALAGVTTQPASKEAPAGVAAPAATAAPAAPKSGAYQVRCWQHGRLLFEENHISLPADAAQYSLKVSGTDRKGQPIYVAETKNATCLIRQASDERAWPIKRR
jgi:hypothetical protein